MGKKRCAVPGCGNDDTRQGISFHQFPSSHDRRKVWLHALGLLSLPCRLVCSAHFANTCFGEPQALQAAGYKRRRLRCDAVPTCSVPHKPQLAAAGDGTLQRTKNQARQSGEFQPSRPGSAFLPTPDLPLDEFISGDVTSIPVALVPSNGGFIRRNNPHSIQGGLRGAIAHFKGIAQGGPAQLQQEPNTVKPRVERLEILHFSKFSQTPARVNMNVQCSLGPNFNTQNIQLRWSLSSEGSLPLYECEQSGFCTTQHGYCSTQDAGTQTDTDPVKAMEHKTLWKMVRHSRHRRRTWMQRPQCPLCL